MKSIGNFFSKSSRRLSVRSGVLLFALTALIFFVPFVFDHGIEPARAEAFSVSSMINDAWNFVLGMVGKLVIGFTGAIFVLTAKLAAIAMEFSTSSSTYTGFDFIQKMWATSRDLINSFLVFYVLYIAFKSALGASGGLSVKSSVVVNIIIAAVLVNFSLFFVKVAVDASNVISKGIYYRIQTISSDGTVDYGPVNGIVQGLKLQTELLNGADTNTMNQLVTILLAGITNIIAATQFAGIIMMFITRTVVIIISMIISPLLFLEYVLPNMGLKSKTNFADTLKGHLMWPPVFFLIMFFVVKYIDFMNKSAPTAQSFSEAFSGSNSSFGILINFAIIIGVLFQSLKVSRSFVKDHKLVGVGQTKFKQATSYAMRNTLGRGASAVSKSKLLTESAKGTSLASTLSRGTLSSAKFLKDSKFDLDKLERVPGDLVKVGAGAGAGLASAGVKTSTLVTGKAAGLVGMKRASERIIESGNKIGEGLEKAGSYVDKKNSTIVDTLRGEVPSTVFVAPTSYSAVEKEANKKLLEDLKKETDKDKVERTVMSKDFQALMRDPKNKEARKTAFDQITASFKDNPQKAEALVAQAFTTTEKSRDANGQTVSVDVNYLDTKEGKKELRKEYESLKKRATSAEAKNVVSKFDGAKLTDLKAKIKNGTASTEEKSAFDDLAANLDKIDAEDIVNIPVERLAALSHKINKKQLDRIGKAIKDGDFEQGDEQVIHDMVSDMLSKGPADKMAKEIAKQITQGKSDFKVDVPKIIAGLDGSKATFAKDAAFYVRTLDSEATANMVMDESMRKKLTLPDGTTVATAISPAAVEAIAEKIYGETPAVQDEIKAFLNSTGGAKQERYIKSLKDNGLFAPQTQQTSGSTPASSPSSTPNQPNAGGQGGSGFSNQTSASYGNIPIGGIPNIPGNP